VYRKDVDDATIAPRVMVELDWLEEQRECNRHMDGPCNLQIGVRARTDVLDSIVLDVPNRRVRRNREVAQCQIADDVEVLPKAEDVDRCSDHDSPPGNASSRHRVQATTATFEYEDPPTNSTEPKVIEICHVGA
jgi:hypothetical protein